LARSRWLPCRRIQTASFYPAENDFAVLHYEELALQQRTLDRENIFFRFRNSHESNFFLIFFVCREEPVDVSYELEASFPENGSLEMASIALEGQMYSKTLLNEWVAAQSTDPTEELYV
jgi:hypothetical protein